MGKAEKADYIMGLLEEDVQEHFDLSDDDTEIRYNTRQTAARLLVKGENVCTVSTDYGLHFAIWLNTEYHDDVKVLLGKILNKQGMTSVKGTRGCGPTTHTHFDVNTW